MPQAMPPAFAGPRRPFTAPPLNAPVAQVGTEPDELFRAWQGSVREASGRRGSWSGGRPGSAAGRRGRGWQAAKIGIPAAVIVTVGAGALLMLTGRANEMLAERAATGPAAPASPAAPAATGFSASLSPAHSTLSGYPGEHGNVAVAAMWSATGLTVAVGAADGHPAAWRRAPDGDWSLVSAAVLGGLPGHLTSVAEGPLGWIAVGSVSESGTVEPMAYQSADGMTWAPLPTLTALAGDSAQFLGVAAGPGGYLVVGRQGSGKNTSAALWHSDDLQSWSNGSSGKTGSLTVAAVSAGNGFVAVGSEMSCHTIWTSPDGKRWTAHDLAKPDGAQAATLTSVAVGASGHIVAAGFATKNGSHLPIVVASADGGAQQTQVVLATASGTGTVTAVTATSDGFVAVGLEGPASAQRAVTWTSADGLAWSAASPLTAAGSNAVTALTDTSAATASSATPNTSTDTGTGTGTSTGTSTSGSISTGPASSSTGSPATGSAVTGSAQDGASPTLLTVPAP
jgi:hypothetical protein